jgi:hypothetical protein
MGRQRAGFRRLKLEALSAARLTGHVSRFTLHASRLTFHSPIPYTSTLNEPGTALGRPFFPPDGWSVVPPNFALAK